MYWYDNLYLGSAVAMSYRRIKRKIEKRKLHPFVYLIGFSTESSSLLEVIPSGFLLQKTYPAESLYIVGMALTHKEAMGLVRKIIEDVYQVDQNLNVHGFFEGAGYQKEEKA